MKKFVYVIIWSLCSFLIPFLWVHASIWDELIINESVSKEKIELIEDYITKHKRKIELFAKKYEIKNNKQLNASINDLSDMIIILRKLKNNSLEQPRIDEIVQKIVEKLKQINWELKPILKDSKEVFEQKLHKKSQQYSFLWAKVWEQLDRLIKNTIENLNKKNLAHSQKKNIITALINLEKESKKLKNFQNIPFSNQKEMKDWFLRILKNIKRELLNVKKILVVK